MGERAGKRAFAESEIDPGGGLRDLCACTADARRRLAAGSPDGPVDLVARLTALVDGFACSEIERNDPATLMVLLDEIGGLVGQLELEREAARARIVALDRHRQAQVSYARGRRAR